MLDGRVDHAHGEDHEVKLHEARALATKQCRNGHKRSDRHEDCKYTPLELVRHHDPACVARHKGNDRDK